MNLPLVDIIPEKHEIWKTRKATFEEARQHYANYKEQITQIKEHLITTITTPLEAAEHLARVASDSSLEDFMDSALSNSKSHEIWRHHMPSKTPIELAAYQSKYPNCDFGKTNDEINKHGIVLPKGQFLFHGGLWSEDTTEFTTERPLSTSLCPQVALRNAEHRGKAYDSEQIDLIVLQVKNPRSKAFIYRTKGTNLGHEKEVLIAAGAKLRLVSRKLIRTDYKAVNLQMKEKLIPIFVLEVDIL